MSILSLSLCYALYFQNVSQMHTQIWALVQLQITNQIKSLLLSHHHSTSALVSEILTSVLQTVQKNNRQFTYGQTVQKNNKQFTYGQTVQKNNKQFTYGQYIFTDCTEDNV